MHVCVCVSVCVYDVAELNLTFELGVDEWSFSEREAEEQAERERLRKQWIREQEQIKSKFYSFSFFNMDA